MRSGEPGVGESSGLSTHVQNEYFVQLSNYDFAEPPPLAGVASAAPFPSSALMPPYGFIGEVVEVLPPGVESPVPVVTWELSRLSQS